MGSGCRNSGMATALKIRRLRSRACGIDRKQPSIATLPEPSFSWVQGAATAAWRLFVNSGVQFRGVRAPDGGRSLRFQASAANRFPGANSGVNDAGHYPLILSWAD